jgi:hypothetical protein
LELTSFLLLPPPDFLELASLDAPCAIASAYGVY